MRAPARRALAIAGVAVVACSARHARAADDAAAEALFEEGRHLVEVGNYDEACPKFAASAKIAPAPGTLLNLADCLEHTGKTASAWAAFREAAAVSVRLQRPDRERVARDRAAALEPRLAYVTVRIASPELDPVVRRDDVIVERGAVGTPLPVDPGAHTFTANAPGRLPWSSTVTVHDGDRVVVRVPALDRAPDLEEGASTPAAPAAPAEDAHVGRTQRILAAGAIGAGVVLVGVGTVFGLSAQAKVDDAKSSPHCRGDVCDPVGGAQIDEAKTSATVSTVSFVAAGALVVGGAVLWLTAPSAPVQASAGPTVGGAAISLRGRF